MERRWLFFDLGSTLIDETEAYSHRIRDMIAGTDITFGQFNEKRRYFAERNMRGDLEAAAFFGLERTPWRTEDERLYPETVGLLEHLSGRGHKLGVIANQSPGTEERMTAFGIRDFFDVVVASAEFGVSKPDKRIFLEALRQAGCGPADAVMIGDRLDNDIYPAAELGMKTVWVRQGFSVYQRLEPERPAPDHIADSLTELTAIDL